ncbi:restriction endonuclease subunit S [Tenacibaculum piscium]|uniref:restriction endonuclease subunit S n=1 Tax=Tenacibaculum piscium TaxID=1458515 RepID=UPI00187B82CE|nr:restriction endonuclease subunit S [Tenacibaculum piscium]MBE7689212.1 restriction endonuclease subunit S [Tenacibaculum piscium]
MTTEIKNINVIETKIQPKKSDKLIPSLRFSEFVGEWEKKLYGDIYSFYTTNSFSRDNLNYKIGEIKNIHYGDIHTKFSTLFDIEKELVPFINPEVNLDRIKNENYCQEGDLVIADASEDYQDIGKTIELVNLNGKKILAGLHTFLARPNKFQMKKGFSGYLVQSWKVRKQVMVIAQGSKVLGIATGRLSKVKLDIPKLPEQEKIAKFLTSVDTKIQQLTRKKETLNQYKKGVMQQLFSQQIRFKKNDGTDFPDWQEKKLGEVCTFFSGGTPTSTNREYYLGEIPFIGSGNIYDSKVFNFITEEALKNSSAKIVEKGDLLYALYGANSGEVSISKLCGAINQAVLCIRTNESVEYLYYLLFLNKNRITSKYLQGGQGNLSSKIIKNLKYNFPSLKEQEKIATYLSAIDMKIAKVETQISQSQTFKKGLLQQLFV